MTLAFRKLRRPTFVNRAGLVRMRASHICGFPQNITVARCEQRETRDSGGEGWYERRLTRGGYGLGGRWGGRKKEGKRKREVERSTTEGCERGCTASGVSSCPVSYVPGPYLFQPHRCTLALSTHPLSAPASLGQPGTSLNSHVTLPATVLHSIYTPTPTRTYFTGWRATHARGSRGTLRNQSSWSW